MNTHDKKPMVAPSDKKFSTTALIGRMNEPVNKNSSTRVEMMIQSSTVGKLCSMPFCESV